MIKVQNMILIAAILLLASATVTIVQPRKTDFPQNKLQYLYANFGIVHYGKSQNYALVILNESLCKNITKQKPFSKPTYVAIRANLSECSYPEKAVTAQNLGARGIIFASEETKYWSGGVVLADDGTGRKVHITSLFITPENMTVLEKLKNIEIRVNFPVVKKEVSDIVLFLQSVGRQNYAFLREFKEEFQKVQDSVNLSISYHTFKCEYCEDSECVLAGSFCQIDIEYWNRGHGAYIIQEQFRQYNLFKYFKDKKQLLKWFEYMNAFDHLCSEDWLTSQNCSLKILKQMDIEQNMNLGDQYSTMMDWRRIQTSSGIYTFPDVTVNGIKHSETLTAESVFDMTCQSLKEPPNACSGKEEKPQKATKTGLIVGLVIGCIVLFLGGIYCYKAMIKKQITNDMSTKVNELVAKYASKVSEQSKKRKQKLMERMTQQI